MKIVEKYSHLNGEEFLTVHRPNVMTEIKRVIANVDAEKCKTKVSKEKTMSGRMLYSPKAMNAQIKSRLLRLGWAEQRTQFWVTADQSILKEIVYRHESEQKRIIEEAGYVPIKSYNQTDFVKDRVALEVQFGKYAFVAHDLFVKFVNFYVSNIIDVGIEVLPVKQLAREMSSGVPYYERDLMFILRQGRAIPTVPLVLLGVDA